MWTILIIILIVLLLGGGGYGFRSGWGGGGFNATTGGVGLLGIVVIVLLMPSIDCTASVVAACIAPT